jgi:hypothetical protein
MSMLTFAIKRTGENLPKSPLDVLNRRRARTGRLTSAGDSAG